MQDEQRGGGHTILTDEIVEQVNRKLRYDRRLTISAVVMNFYTIITEKFGYHNLCAGWVSKMVTDEHKDQRICSGRAFLDRHRPNGGELYSHIATGAKSGYPTRTLD